VRYGSVCSGIEAATVAWHPLGWEPQWFSEIEAFPSSVLKHHYPETPNYGDMTKFKEWSDEPIDLFVGGTPCQSFSVAGLRKGMDDPRGNLALTYLAIADKYRPRWLVWENVPGVLSSNGGRDFGSFLGAMGQLGYGFAYRVLDAQYFGVAQRRRRVFVVGYLGDWRRAAAVLFERESLSGHPAPSREAGEDVADSFAPCVGSGKKNIGTLMANAGTKLWLGNQEALSGDYHILQPIAFSSNMSVPDCQTDGSTPTLKLGGHGGGNPPAVAFGRGVHTTLDSLSYEKGWCNQAVQQGLGVFCRASGQTNAPTYLEQSPTLNCNGDLAPFINQSVAVRRLTPRECERLQGFPDDYTLTPHRNKPAADGPRYKALGNSMAVPVMRWIGERIEMVDKL
jgi:DNA (cytosine-5)-methyltransferase 1